MVSPALSLRRFAKTPGPPSVALTWPSRTAGPRSPGVGESLYQLAGAPGSPGGTSSEPLSRSPRLSSSDPVSMAGMVNDTGSDAGRTGNWAGAGAGVPGAGVVGGGVGAGVVGVAETVDEAVASPCVWASVAQPVSMRRATAAEAAKLPRRALGEPIMESVRPISSLSMDIMSWWYCGGPGRFRRLPLGDALAYSSRRAASWIGPHEPGNQQVLWADTGRERTLGRIARGPVVICSSPLLRKPTAVEAAKLLRRSACGGTAINSG